MENRKQLMENGEWKQITEKGQRIAGEVILIYEL
jgi:hypothetical protein